MPLSPVATNRVRKDIEGAPARRRQRLRRVNARSATRSDARTGLRRRAIRRARTVAAMRLRRRNAERPKG
ncbi:hypothetical protein, partial [Methylibium sp.]|uniref:hypothetical protein n=1 Tax=Methylibium sp. TaxID=2067992 RepID=UPI0025E9BE91